MLSPREIYVILQVIGCVILVAELIYVSLQKPSELQKHLIFLLLTIFISFLGYLYELIADNLMGAFVGVCLGYVGKPFALLASLLLLLEYSNIHINKYVYIGFIVYFIVLTLIVITNPWHHLYYKEIVYDVTKTGSPLRITIRGVFWYVYIISSILIFFAYSFVTIYEYTQSKTKQAKQMSIMLFLVVFFAFLGLFLFIFDLTYNYDTTLSGILIGTIIMIILLTKYKMFDTLTVAKQKTLNESEDGVIVLDARMALTYFNTTASKLIPDLKENMGRKNETLLIVELDKLKEGQLFFKNDKVYKLIVTTEKIGTKDRVIGKRYTFKEITEHYNYNNILAKEVSKSTAKIKSIQRDALVSFAEIVEARDGNTGEHIKSVSKTAYLIGCELKKRGLFSNTINDEFLTVLKECAPLHDIGKIYIPDAILLKPGKLTPEEFDVMKTHTTNGAEIIDKSMKGIEEPIYVRISKEIALSHHERFDGTGYPNKLKGKNIPLSARILAVADVYDALRMKRSYKEAFSKEKSIDIIKEERGTHFDPDIVDAFLNIVDNI